MKRFMQLFSLFSLVVISCWSLLSWTQPVLAGSTHSQPVMMQSTKIALANVEGLCVEDGKIDLNNANVIAFRDCPGFYPTLARLIVQNGPYQQVKDVLKISGLSERQKELLQRNLDNFKISSAVVPSEQRMPPRPVLRK